MDAQELANALRDRRKSLHLTQPGLAALAGCSERFVRELESGKPGIRLDKLQQVLDVLGLELRVEPRRTG
jgi:HTH-type transcriptional regulator/antitoxin HipB